MEILGIDLGGVIFGPRDMSISRSDEGFREAYLNRPEVQGAIDAVGRLSRERFEGRVRVVSKRKDDGSRALALEWLRLTEFYAIANLGIPDVYFCTKRSDKGQLCADLDITHFVDNRLEVLSGMPESVVGRYLLNPNRVEIAENVRHLPLVTQVASWQEILDILLPS